MNSRKVLLSLILIGLISLGLKLYTVDFSLPIYSDDLGFTLDAISFSNGDFFIYPKKNPGWSIFLTPFMQIIESDKFIDYSNIVRTLSLVISTVTIAPLYLLSRKFFDAKYSIVASSLFAFEPHLNYISGFGLAEPLYVLILVTSFLLMLNKNEKLVYLSFILVGLLWWVRLEGIVMFFALSLIYFLLLRRKSNKIILKYSVCVAIVVLIIIPNLVIRYYEFGDPLFFYFENVIFAEDYAKLDTGIQDYSAFDYIEEKGPMSFIQKFILSGFYNIFSLLSRILFPYLIVLLPFGIFFSFRAFDQKKEYLTANWIVILTILVTLTVIFANVPERRYLYTLFPFFIIFATIPIQRVTEYGLSTFSYSNKQKNIFLISVLIVVILLSTLFTILRFENVDVLYEREQIEFARLVSELEGGIYDSGEALNYLTYARITDSNDSFDKQKIIGPAHHYERYILFLDEQEMDLQPLGTVHRVYVDGKTIDQLILNSKDIELKYIAITNDGPYYRPYVQDVYLNEQNYPFFKKIFDSNDLGFKKYKVKVFQIDYEKFESYN